MGSKMTFGHNCAALMENTTIWVSISSFVWSKSYSCQSIMESLFIINEILSTGIKNVSYHIRRIQIYIRAEDVCPNNGEVRNKVVAAAVQEVAPTL